MTTKPSTAVKNEVTSQILKDFYKFWETGDEALLASSTSKDVKDYDRNPTVAGTDYEATLQLGQSVKGLSELIHNLVQIHYLEDDQIFVRWEATAKHTGEVFGYPPTNKTVYFNGHDTFKIKNGKIKELWHIEQLLQLTYQLQ